MDSTEKNILLVDDEERFLHSTRKLLEKRGYQVETATDGLQALERLKSADIGLVILDVRMPYMDGVSALKQIRRDYPAVETILLTGHGSVENAVEGMRLGAALYLTKPVDVDDLAEAIESVLDRRRLIDTEMAKRRQDFDRHRFRLFWGLSAILGLPYLMALVIFGIWWHDAGYLATRLSWVLFDWMAVHRHLVGAVSVSLFLVIPVLSWLLANQLMQMVRRLTEKRDELQFQLLHASKLASIGELAIGVAHEVNNPLAVIVARCGIIQDLLDPTYSFQPDPAAIRVEIDTIRQAAFRARRITTDLINFGLKGEPQVTRCNLNRLLDDVIDGLKVHEWQQNRIELVQKYDPELPDTWVDDIRIKQVLVNLLNNAREAINGPGTIEVATRRGRSFLEVSITDSGRGLDADEIKQIFRPFYTTKPVGEGTGLSLSVSLSIVESHGGMIDVRSEPGVGSTFVVSLPYRK